MRRAWRRRAPRAAPAGRPRERATRWSCRPPRVLEGTAAHRAADEEAETAACRHESGEDSHGEPWVRQEEQGGEDDREQLHAAPSIPATAASSAPAIVSPMPVDSATASPS